MTNDILRCFGGVEHNSLAHLIGGNQNVADNGVFDSIKQSIYIDDEDVEEVLNIKENDFVILSLNCQSLSAKIDSLKVLINQINNQHKLSAICLQETWLSSESDTSLFEIQGYNLISAGKYCSPHSGLMIYLREDYNFTILNLHTQSMIWDGLFIEIHGKALGRKHIIVGNIYRPPRDVLQNYQTFTSELASIITVLSKSKCEVVLSGDYNIDLLKLNDNTNISDFFDTITGLTFYPIITLPTMFSDRRCT